MPPTPVLHELLNDRSRLIQAATAAGQAMARHIGTQADKKADEARKLANKTRDPALKARYLQEAGHGSLAPVAILHAPLCFPRNDPTSCLTG